MYQKVIIFGFPHCGTTILRCILSHIPGVHEIVDETRYIRESNIPSDTKFVICKWPYTPPAQEIEQKYKDYIKIFITRNPLFIFSSLNRRFNGELAVRHQIRDYTESVKQFNKYSSTPLHNMYLIEYEKMFDENHEYLKGIFQSIGFEFTDDIFKNENYQNKVQFMATESVPTEQPPPTSHNPLRLYQVNQPFVNGNSPDKISLLPDQLHKLKMNPDVCKRYPEVETFLLENTQIFQKKDMTPPKPKIPFSNTKTQQSQTPRPQTPRPQTPRLTNNRFQNTRHQLPKNNTRRVLPKTMTKSV